MKKVKLMVFNIPEIDEEGLIPYGKLINPEKAKETILKVPGPDGEDLGKLFLEVFNRNVILDKLVGVRYRDFNSKYSPMPMLFVIDYLIGKVKGDSRVEMILRGGDGPLSHILGIGLDYNGNSMSFEPRVPEKKTGLLYRLGLKRVKEPTNREKFPLFQKKYWRPLGWRCW